MQTRFTEAQLADPETAAAEKILRRCVHCGFCSATCPTYVLLGDELDSPRGRIYLIKEMLENGRPATPEVVRHLDQCLSCLACVTTCPSGVDYRHLIDHARIHVERTYRRPWADRALRAGLAAVLPYPRRFRYAVALAALLRPVAKHLPRRLARLIELGAQRSVAIDAVERKRSLPTNAPQEREREAAAPHGAPRAQGTRGMLGAHGDETQGELNVRSRRPRIAVLSGCVQSVLSPEIDSAARRLLTLAGADVVSVPGCCGAIVHHLGREGDSSALARTLIARLDAEIEGQGLDAIAVTASGCGTHVKDFGHLFRNDDDAELAAKAAAVASRARDITEVLVELGLPEPTTPQALTVAYHSACSLQHGQKVERPPRLLLERAGYRVAEIPEGHLCCGSAGTYNVLQTEIAERLKDRKIDNIARTGADVVAAGNIGCIRQLADGAEVPIVHTVELLDRAYGAGPEPSAK